MSTVEHELQLTLIELCTACDLPQDEVTVWVVEGMLEPAGGGPEAWRFGSEALRRARTAKRLARDLAINTAGIALALDLLEEIESLRGRLRRHNTL